MGKIMTSKAVRIFFNRKKVNLIKEFTAFARYTGYARLIISFLTP